MDESSTQVQSTGEGQVWGSAEATENEGHRCHVLALQECRALTTGTRTLSLVPLGVWQPEVLRFLCVCIWSPRSPACPTQEELSFRAPGSEPFRAVW